MNTVTAKGTAGAATANAQRPWNVVEVTTLCFVVVLTHNFPSHPHLLSPRVSGGGRAVLAQEVMLVPLHVLCTCVICS